MGLFRRLWEYDGLCVTRHIQYGWTKAVDGKSVFTEIRKAYIQGLTALTANPIEIRHKVCLGKRLEYNILYYF